MNPLISIIIPLYNLENYIEKCLSSILSQTYQNWECIIINDYSSDNSKEIVKNYIKKDIRFSYVENSENLGVSNTRNKGINIARGEFIVFVDADDWVEPNFLTFFIDNIQDSNTLIVQDIIKDYINHTKVNTQGYKNEEFTLPKELKALLSNYKLTQGYVCNKLYNLSIIKQNSLYFYDNINNEDEIFYFEYLQYILKVKFIKNAQYHYIQRDLSRSRTPKFIPTYNYLLKVISINYNIKNLLNKNNEEINFIKEYSSGRFTMIFNFCLRNIIYNNCYPFKERVKYLKLLFKVLSDNSNLLQPAKTIPQKIDLFLLKNKFFLLADLFLKLRKSLQ